MTAPALAQAVVYSAGVTPIAYGSNVTKNNLLVAAFTRSTSSITAITDSVGSVWRKAAGVTGAAIWWAVAGASGANSLTITATGNWEAYVYEVGGFLGIPVVDQATTATGAAVPSIGPLATTMGPEFLVAICDFSGAGTGGEAGWTVTISPNSNVVEYIIVSSTGSYTATMTPSDPAWIGAFATFGSPVLSPRADAIFFNGA